MKLRINTRKGVLCFLGYIVLQSCVGTGQTLLDEPPQTVEIEEISGHMQEKKDTPDSALPELIPEEPSSEIPSTIVFLETDIAGNPIADMGTYDSILQELSDAGFNLVYTEIQAEQFLPYNTSNLYSLLRKDYEVRRLIVGSAGINEVDESLGFTIRVTGSLRVYDLLEERNILSSKAESSAQGSSSAHTINLAFANLGRDLGKHLIENLP